MDFQKYTEKSIEAIQSASALANEQNNAQIEQEHLFVALLSQENGFIIEVFKSMNIQIKMLIGDVLKRINNFSKVSGGQVSISNELSNVFSDAEKQAKNMKDDFISVEHLILGLLNKANRFLSDILKGFNINKIIVITVGINNWM